MRGNSRHHRGLMVAAMSFAVALVAPAASNAAITIGQVNPATPAGGGNCVAQDVYTTRKSAATIINATQSPGVITSWSTRATDTAGQQAMLKTISQTGAPGAVTYTVQGTSDVQTLTPSSLNRFATRIPIAAGQGIGYFVANGADNSQSCVYFSADNNNEAAAGPSTGQAGNSFTDVDGSSNRVVNLSATLEADADGDGFGDETQDRCPGVAGSNGGCTASGGAGGVDTKKPTIGSLSFSHTTFKAATSGGAFSSKTKKKKKVPTGTKVSFNLSEASSVKFTVQRKTKGRKVGSKCKTKTRANRKKKSCTLYKSVRGSFTVSGKAGKNSFTFRGRMGGKALRRGSYRLSGTATDPAKNASVPTRKGFRIVK
jgi:hypothetical protein